MCQEWEVFRKIMVKCNGKLKGSQQDVWQSLPAGLIGEHGAVDFVNKSSFMHEAKLEWFKGE